MLLRSDSQGAIHERDRGMIKSHEIAKKLLSMPDAYVEVVVRVSGEYVKTNWIEAEHNIWEFMGNIRIQPVEIKDCNVCKEL